MRLFITAIGTDCGKTVISSIFCEALKADYWKPVQAGTPTDSSIVRNLVSNSQTVIHPERFLLTMPASPHLSAEMEKISISLDDFILPFSQDIVIEGAGGCLVPLNNENFVIDIASKFSCDVVLVSNHYLGSINHTLLTWEALHARGLNVVGVVFNGARNRPSEDIILHHTGLPCLLRVDQETEINKKTVLHYARTLNENRKSGQSN
jgi:dethiobiotin synthetase